MFVKMHDLIDFFYVRLRHDRFFRLVRGLLVDAVAGFAVVCFSRANKRRVGPNVRPRKHGFSRKNDITEHCVMALNKPFDDGRKQIFLVALSVDGGIQHACDTAGINYKTYLAHRKKDENFNEEVEAALRLAAEEVWTAAKSRFVNGVKEPVIGGRNKDTIVTHVDRYSDSFLIPLAKKLDPHFAAASGGGANGGGSAGLAATDAKCGVLLAPPELTVEQLAALFDFKIEEGDPENAV